MKDYKKILAISLIFLVISYFFWKKTEETVKNLDITKQIDFNDVDFA